MVGAASAAAASFPIVHARARLSQPDCVERRSRIGAVDSKPLADGDPEPYVAVVYDHCFKAITPGSSVDPARGSISARSVRLSAQDTHAIRVAIRPATCRAPKPVDERIALPLLRPTHREPCHAGGEARA